MRTGERRDLPALRPRWSRSSRGTRWGAVAAILGLFVVTLAFLVTRTGGTLLGDTTVHPVSVELLGQMADGDRVVQPLAATQDRLAAVQLRLGTYGGAADCTLDVALREDDGDPADATGPVVAQRQWSCSDLADSAPMELLTFEPVADSADRRYEVVVERVDGRDTPGAVLWASPLREGLEPAVVGGEPSDLAGDVRPLYDPQPRWWDHLDEITDRMADYGPSWATAGAFAMLLLVLAVLLGLLPLTVRAPRALLVVVALLALVRGLVWAAAVPAFGGMDEPAHFSNVQFMVVEQDLPGQADNPHTYSDQVNVAHDHLNLVASPPGDRPDYSEAGEERTTRVIEDAAQTGGGGGPAAAYPPPYYLGAAALTATAGDSFFDQVMAARLWSVLLGVGAAVLLLLLGRRLFPRSPLAQVGFAAAGVLQPMASHQFAIVNNDAWVILMGFAGLLVALDLARRPRAPWLALAAGLIIGGGLLGKPFGIAVGLPLAVGWLVGKVRWRVRSWRTLAGEAALVVVGFAATYGLWRVVAGALGIAAQRVPVLEHDGLTLREFAGASLRGARWIWGSQMWGNFGWVRIPLPEPIPTLIFAGLLAVGMAVLAWAFLVLDEARLRRRTRRAGAALDPALDTPPGATASPGSRHDTAAEATGAATLDGRVDERVDEPGDEPDDDPDDAPDEATLDARILVCAAFVGGMVVTLYAAAWIYYSSTGRNDLLQGRYALMALPAVLALPALLLERFTRGRVSPAVVTVPLAVTMGVLTLLGLKRVLEAFYG